MRKILVLTALMMITGVAFAQSTVNPNSFMSHFFEISPQDQSLVYLKLVFGQVGNLFSADTWHMTGAAGQAVNTSGHLISDTASRSLFGVMFAKFNEAMLILNTIIIAYTTVFGLVASATEGEFLGKKMNSFWVPLRAVLGIGLLIPTKSGYCLLQIIMMWVVIQGVGAADTVWTAAVKHIAHHGTGGGQVQDHPLIVSASQQQMANIFGYFVCSYEYQKMSGGSRETLRPTVIQNTTVADQATRGMLYTRYVFPGVTGVADPSLAKPACGSFAYPESSQPMIKNWSKTSEGYQAQALASGIPQVMGNLNSAAQEYVYDCDSNPGALPGCLSGNPISTTAETMTNQIVSKQNDFSSNVTPGDIGIDTSRGWAFAGAYFYIIAQHDKAVANVADIWNSIVTTKIQSAPAALSAGVNRSSIAEARSALIQADPKAVPIVQATQGDPLTYFGGNMGAPFRIMTNWIAYAFVESITGSNGVIIDGNYISDGENPVIGVQRLGDRIISITEFMFFIVFGLLLALAITGACGAINPAFGAGLVITFFIHWLATLIGAMFAIGLTLSVYVPLVPYIIFFFGVLGWIIAVIEAMLAAPMVALGLTHPEGHEVFGRAEPAVQLLTNVFIRPTLMVFGMIAGILLSYVALDFLNATFDMVLFQDTGITQTGSAWYEHLEGTGIGPFQFLTYIIVYVTMIVILINRCFSLIHIFPDRILAWISNQTQFGQYGGDEEKVAGRAEGKTQAVGQLGGSQSAAMGAAKGAGMKVGAELAKDKFKGPDGGGGPDGGSPPADNG